MDPDPFSHFKSLDPSRMSVAEVYDVLNALSNAQDEDRALLEFNLNDGVVVNLISLYSVDQDIVEVPDPSSTTNPRGKGKGRKRLIKNAVGTNDDIPDFSPPSRANPDGPPEAGDRHSPADATPTARGERLPHHIIISALEAVAAHDPTLIPPTPASGVPIASTLPQHGQRRDRVDEESVSEGDRVKKRVRYEEPRSPREATETEAPLTVNSSRPTSNATTATTGKAAKPKTGAKKSTKAAGVPAPPVQKGRKPSASKVPKPPPPPPARISKRYADFPYNIGKL
jgi:hypothetical protein